MSHVVIFVVFVVFAEFPLIEQDDERFNEGDVDVKFSNEELVPEQLSGEGDHFAGGHDVGEELLQRVTVVLFSVDVGLATLYFSQYFIGVEFEGAVVVHFMNIVAFDFVFDHEFDDFFSLLHDFDQGHVDFDFSQHVRFVVDLLDLGQVFHDVVVVDGKGDVFNIDEDLVDWGVVVTADFEFLHDGADEYFVEILGGFE